MGKNEYIIRPVRPEDAEQYFKLNNLVWRSAYKDIFPEEVFKNRESEKVINKEKLKDYSLLTKEEIDGFLRKNVFEDMSDIKIRKLVINTLVRQIYLYEDKIVILFNFTTPPDKPKLTLEENIQTAEQITSALNNPQSSCILPQSAP